ncbi:LAQU0S02e00760g1_1 [Lachancea quebecensis]|uniref:LAQU0S02e00760g1_1 n=1 Tax=Lachancea quebecensis TaxID=1654605 RepID=A0A0P1KNT9_9SACH|nr:LAQU0S02e00760g1_1 [Lachancea quebecensis]
MAKSGEPHSDAIVDTSVRRQDSEVSRSSCLSPSPDECLNEESQLIMEKAKLLIEKLKTEQILNPGEHPSPSGIDSFCDRDHNGHIHLESVKNSDALSEESQPNHEIVQSLEALVHLASKAREQAKQLRFKNFMLTAGLKDTNSRFEVETSLTKQQFERIRCQLVMECQELQQKVHLQDLKLSKYKETIIEKNKEINKLGRLLNDSGVAKSLHVRNTPQSVTKKAHLDRSSKAHRKDSGMLATLGLLATQVLSDKSEHSVNVDNTESDISHDSFSNQTQGNNAQAAKPFLSTPILPKLTRTSFTSPHDDAPSENQFQIPKLRSFSTLEDSLKDPQ